MHIYPLPMSPHHFSATPFFFSKCMYASKTGFTKPKKGEKSHQRDDSGLDATATTKVALTIGECADASRSKKSSMRFQKDTLYTLAFQNPTN
uniref:Ovule protein n=1 Tax=Panagrellus redivivus TaxID=6233 RepID=A0A7E4W4S8_PANRE